MYEHLQDFNFLSKLDKMNIRVTYAKIILLTFDEKPLKEIQGNILSGSLNLNGSAAIRRTVNLTMVAPPSNFSITDLNNDVALNKKVRIEIGYKNPFEEYDEIVWFPCGVFIISTSSVTKSLSGWNITIQGRDKMALLDGSVGGTLPASVTFHESYEYSENGNIIIKHPTIFKIIQEAVHHFGQEDFSNILINDIPNTAKLLIKYIGEDPIYFSKDYHSIDTSYSENYPNKYWKGQDIGYKETDFTYPGELILNAGETVVTLLNKICTLLGNFEFFYDISGRFIFREKRNYINKRSPLFSIQASEYISNLDEKDYLATYSNDAHKYEFVDFRTVSALTMSPKYSNIKNDYIVWGEKETPKGKRSIRYHLAIDKKPEDSPAAVGIELCSNCYKNCVEILDENDKFLRYATYLQNQNEINKSEKEKIKEGLVFKSLEDFNWREEIFRLALLNPNAEDYYYPYYAEFLSEWRKIFDSTKWDETGHYNPEIIEGPNNLDFWIDFINSPEIDQYSIPAIGRRSLVVNDSDVKTVYNNPILDIIFIENVPEEGSPDYDQTKREEFEQKLQKYNNLGQKYFILTPEYMTKFQGSSTKASAFEKIRELLYQHLNYNTQITITCLPKYFLEPNDVIYVEDRDLGILNNYEISQITLPLNYSGTMSIIATEILMKP